MPLLMAAACALAACGGSSTPADEESNREAAYTPPVERFEMTVSYQEPRTQDDVVAQEILELGGLTGIAERFTDTFDFPVDIKVRARPGNGSPYYDPSTRTITVFYGFVNTTAEIIRSSQPGISQRDFGTQWASVNDFIFVHEIGHAFVDVFDIPITGREEDAVDGMATTFLTDQVEGGAEYAFYAAVFFEALQGVQGAPDIRQFADEHSLSIQRSFDIVCAVAGSSKATLRQVAQLEILPPERLSRCPSEYEQKSSAWQTLLEPHLRGS